MRLASEADLPEIMAIYNDTVPTRQSTADTLEVSLDSKRDWFRQHDPARRPILVHEIQGRVAAWVSFQSFYGRPAYKHTAELSIYVAAGFRSQGLGRQLLDEALGMTTRLGIKTLLGYIFSHNEPSIRLFRSCGFAEWGRLPRIAEMDGRECSLSIYGKRVNP